jgi:hypothetical protein
MAKTLPPFSGDDPVCPKCSYAQAFTEYKPEGEPRSGRGSGMGEPERLERRCARCDFLWDESLNPPADDPATPGPKGGNPR